jgi:hypothetical protein
MFYISGQLAEEEVGDPPCSPLSPGQMLQAWLPASPPLTTLFSRHRILETGPPASPQRVQKQGGWALPVVAPSTFLQ